MTKRINESTTCYVVHNLIINIYIKYKIYLSLHYLIVFEHVSVSNFESSSAIIISAVIARKQQNH